MESAGKRRDLKYKNMDMKRKIYVASSWRNEYYPEVVEKLREAGWFAGSGKLTIAYIPEKQEPELMYKLFSCVCCSIEELVRCLKQEV